MPTQNSGAFGRGRTFVLSMVETALLVAISFVLSYFLSFRIMPQGGSVTVAASVPLLLIGIRRGLPWGIAGAFVYALLQALLDKAIVPPAAGLGTYALMMLLDYVVAFSSYGLSGLMRNKKYALLYAVPICSGVRFVSHYLSGIILWRSYSWTGWAPELYSAAYNLAFIVPDAAIAFAAALLLYKTMPKKFLSPQ